MSLSHILAPEPTPPPNPPATEKPEAPESQTPSMAPPKREDEKPTDTPKTEPAAGDEQTSPNNEQLYTSTTTSTRRNASGSVSSVYSGNKIKHLKKDDGIPLFRKDIQYDFLKLVFFDQTRCFTKYSDGSKGNTFAEIYIDAMAKSSKTSKILKEKLLQDTDGAVCMAMVCLLVNVGRMNTTLNFFPEMRAQLRTYHSIPALQANQDPNAYKQLQDAPRLKSILKGATEDEPQPSTIEEIKAAKVPRTNPVNLIFVISQYAPKISDVHFPNHGEFFDLIIRPTLSSASRARAFLWLMWWYLESDFSGEAASRNPFGQGQFSDGDQEAGNLPLKVPSLESLTEDQAKSENIDTEDEILFGEKKRKERIAILASEPSPAMTALKRARKEKGLVTGAHGHGMYSEDEASEAGWSRAYMANRNTGRNLETGSEYTRSPSPAGNRGFAKGDMRINNLLNNEEGMSEASPPHAVPPVKKGPGRGNWRRKKAVDTSTPQAIRPDDRSHHIPLLPNTGQLNFVNEAPQTLQSSPSGYPNNNLTSTGSYKPTMSYQASKRGVTQHQQSVMNHRAQQINYTLDRRLRRVHTQARSHREAEGSILRAWKRIRLMPVDYDSEEERIKSRKKDRTEGKEEDWRLSKGKENVDFSDLEPWQRPRLYMAGLVRVSNEENDVGEEAKSVLRAFERCQRRLKRWEEAAPADAMIQRQELQAKGLLHPTRRRKAVAGGQEGGNGYLSRQRRRRSTRDVDKMEIDGEEDEGPAELDEEDRELLGEVDAAETEGEEEEDEDMADD